MTKYEMQKALVHSAIHVVADHGIAHVTTDAIAKGAQLNVAYLYRFCGGKEKLLEYTFTELDLEFRDCLLRCVDIMHSDGMNGLSFKERFWVFFANVWKFIMSDREKCAYFIYYYHSILFNTYSQELRKKHYEQVLVQFSSAFREFTDVWMLLNHIFDVLFSAAIKVLRNQVEVDDRFVVNVSEMIYRAIEPYLKDEKRCS